MSHFQPNLILNPHGSDETEIWTWYNTHKKQQILNPHGSDETGKLKASLESLIENS